MSDSNLFKRVSRTTLVVILLTSSAWAVSSEARNCTVTWDDFSQGLAVSNTPDLQNKWFYFSVFNGTTPLFIGNDGVATTKNNTLLVKASGQNPSTGKPAFTKYVAPEGVNNNPYFLPGGFDHVKWLAYMNHTSQVSKDLNLNIPGFSAPTTGSVACAARFQGQTYGTEGALRLFSNGSVLDPYDDLRLAGSALNVIDFQTYMVFDMFVSNETVYAFYERLPFGRGQTGFSTDYAAFSYAIPVGTRSNKGDFEDLQVSYNKSKGTVSWFLNDDLVYQVNRIGYKLENQLPPFTSKYSRAHPPIMLLNHGGKEETASPNQIDCGMGMFTLLDGHLNNNPARPELNGKGLVQLSNTPGFYVPDLFQYKTDNFNVAHYLWGQGASLQIKNFKVRSPDVCFAPNATLSSD